MHGSNGSRQRIRFTLRFSNAGDLVCSPFGGVGTDVEACLLTGRRLLTAEVDEARFQAMKARHKEVLQEIESELTPPHYCQPNVCVVHVLVTHTAD